ncbi:MAG: TIM barrel protein [Pirellulales bacterium]|nr:TIM barrel protein [Pirellulales bacterium]
MMHRRDFLATGLAATAAAALASGQTTDAKPAKHQFKLKYAPHFGMFRNLAGDDPIDELKFMADVGFTALEDNGMAGRPVELQKKIAATMERLDMEMGVFVATGDFGRPTFASGDSGMADKVLADMRAAVEVAKRVRAKWCTVVPGAFDIHLQKDYQTANVVELLKRCAAICEPSGLVMVLEPLNHWSDHPGLFLSEIPQAYLICKAVGSPSCKILDDLYHQQISEGNLIPNLDRAWSEIAYFQVGDNPGRNEPTTGEINFKNVFKHLHAKGYQGIVGMEHGVAGGGADGEKALINAYAEVDSFEA